MHQQTGSDYPGPAERLDSAFLGFHFIVWMLMGCVLLRGAVPSKVVMSNHMRGKNSLRAWCPCGDPAATLEIIPFCREKAILCLGGVPGVLHVLRTHCPFPARPLQLRAQFRGEAVDGSGGISEPLFCSLRCRRVGMTHAASQNLLANVSSVLFKHTK